MHALGGSRGHEGCHSWVDAAPRQAVEQTRTFREALAKRLTRTPIRHRVVSNRDTTLKDAADRALRFTAGLRLDDQPIDVQREYLLVFRELQKAVETHKIP
jgi:hypothetical protein